MLWPRVLRSKQFDRTRPARSADKPFDPVAAAREEGPSLVQSLHESASQRGGRLTTILTDACAFANTAGGTIYIGVGQRKGPPKGLSDPKQTRSEIEKAISERVAPPLAGHHRHGGNRRGQDSPSSGGQRVPIGPTAWMIRSSTCATRARPIWPYAMRLWPWSWKPRRISRNNNNRRVAAGSEQWCRSSSGSSRSSNRRGRGRRSSRSNGNGEQPTEASKPSADTNAKTDSKTRGRHR